MEKRIADYHNIFFIGIAGAGMSAIAQYLAGTGHTVSGSDRFFKKGEYNDTRAKLEAEGILCFLQDGEGITTETDLAVASTAVEDTVSEVQKAMQLGIPILLRSEVLALIANSKRTIAVGGTSGKSTTSAMLFDILEFAGMHPSIISGAGLARIMKEEKIGNASVGTGDWLIIEADESDGSIVKYEPEIGLLLNVDKDHQEIGELMQLFTRFRDNTKEAFIVNRSNEQARQLTKDISLDFSTDELSGSGYIATDFNQLGLSMSFMIARSQMPTAKCPFILHTIGRHNMENALAATAVAGYLGIDLDTCSRALEQYAGIYRRHQVLGQKKGVWVIDDFAHNPVKCAASIAACQQVAPKVIAWFQPHGYGPTKFLRHDFVKEISAVLRPEDEIWMSEIFYAGGTAIKEISGADLINDIKALGKTAFFVEDRYKLLAALRPHLTGNCVLLLMGARDPGLEQFAKEIYENL